MKRRLRDGSYIPSNLSIGDEHKDARTTLRNNFALRPGIVTHIYYPDDEQNRSKLNIEYDVAVTEADSRRGVTISVYRKCRVNNIFGAPNDNLSYTLEPATQKNEDGNLTNGSTVLLLLMNGVSDNSSAVIIGGLSHPNAKKFSKEDGKFYDFEFNGLNWNINKDGELTVEFNSATNVKGERANEEAAGTKIKFDKEGRLKISDNEDQFLELDRDTKTTTWSNGSESIVINKEEQSISLKSEGEVSQESKGNASRSSDGDIEDSASNITQESEGDITQESGGNYQGESGANWNIKAGANVQIEAGANAIIKGATLAQLEGTTNIIGSGGVQAAGVGISQCIGVGNKGSIVNSQVITGSSTVFIGA